MLNNIVIKVDGPDWTAGDFMFFDNIIGPELYSSPAYIPYPLPCQMIYQLEQILKSKQ